MNERDFQMYLNFEQHRVTERFFNRLEPEVRGSLTPEQRKDITRALVRSFLYPNRRLLDIRCVIPFFRKRHYLVFLLGPETREGDPRYFSRYLSRSKWFPNTLFLIFLAGVLFCSLLGIKQIFTWLFS